MNVGTIVGIIMGCGGFWSLLQYLVVRHFSKKDKRSDELSEIKSGLLGLMHQELITECECFLKAGKITIHQLSDLEKYVYKPYEKMGGNGSGAEMFERVKSLPIVEEGEIL